MPGKVELVLFRGRHTCGLVVYYQLYERLSVLVHLVVSLSYRPRLAYAVTEHSISPLFLYLIIHQIYAHVNKKDRKTRKKYRKTY